MSKLWVKNAPEPLILALESGDINAGRNILERLLRDNRMALAWSVLARKIQGDEKKWLRVWHAIANAKSESNRASRSRTRRSDERDRYNALAGRFAALAKKIENGPLDVLAYDLLSQDSLDALHIPSLHRLNSLHRAEIAHKIMADWPSAPELLRGLEKLALTVAGDSMDKLRPDERSSGDVQARIFIHHLGSDFWALFQSHLLGTLGKIADVTLQRSQDIDRSFVQRSVKGVSPKRGSKIWH